MWALGLTTLLALSLICISAFSLYMPDTEDRWLQYVLHHASTLKPPFSSAALAQSADTTTWFAA